jgi:hypothetical protein
LEYIYLMQYDHNWMVLLVQILFDLVNI